MIVVENNQALAQHRSALVGRVAFVPTMGSLHAGHLSLVEQACELADHVIVSIFVNPLQFSPGEDLDSYPGPLQQDLDLLAQYPVDIAYTPDEQQLYAQGRAAQTQVLVPNISTQLCGASRPNFFSGIATVVAKLFQLVRPDVAVFGQKDYQQWLVIRQLVRDLHFNIELVMAPIVREADGLAMSSRNQYLTAHERALAPKLYQSLLEIKLKIEGGEPIDDVLSRGLGQLGEDFEVDYCELRRADDLAPVSTLGSGDKGVVLGAVMLGRTRLIDNLIIQV